MKFFLILIWVLLATHMSLAQKTDNTPITNLLTSEDKKVLEIGPMGDTRYILGGILGTAPGFGIGHAIQGRWLDKGWIFTLGELITLTLFAGSTFGCIGEGLFETSNDRNNDSNCNLAGIAYLGFLGFKGWEISDIWYQGYQHRKKFKNLNNKINRKDSNNLNYLFLPIVKADQYGLGLSVRF